MKRDGAVVLSPPKPPRAVHGRLSQLESHPDPLAPDPRLSHADSVVAPTFDVPDPSSTLELAQESCWVVGSLIDPPLPDGVPGSLVVDPPSPPGLTASSYRGTLPPPAPTQVLNSDISARARMAAV